MKEKKEKKIEETEKKKKVNGKVKSSQQKLVVKFQWKKNNRPSNFEFIWS